MNNIIKIKNKSVLSNIFILISSKFISLLLMLVSNIFIARYLSVSLFGAFNYSKSIASILVTLTFMGIPTLMVKDMAVNKQNTSFYYNTIFSYRIIMNIFCIILIFIMVITRNYSFIEKKFIIIIASTYVVSSSIISLNESIFQAYSFFNYIAITNIVYATVNFLIMFSSYILKYNYMTFILLHILNSFITIVINTYIIKKCICKINFNINKKKFIFLLSKLKESINIFLTILFALINNYFDILFLNIMKGNVSVSYYSAGAKLFPVFNIIPSMVMKVIFPRISKADKLEAKKDIVMVLKVLFYIYLLVLIVVTYNSKLIIHIIFGYKYDKACGVLIILTYALIGTYILYPILWYLNATNNYYYARNITLIMSISNIIANSILINKYDFIGAAVGTFIATIIAGVLSIYILIKIKVLESRFVLKIIVLFIFNIININIISLVISNNLLKTILAILIICIVFIINERKHILSFYSIKDRLKN